MKRAVLALLFFLSGAAGLIYQVVWGRYLTLLFGSTTLAVSTVVTSFMAGLGLGSYLFGRYVDRTGRPLRLYAVLEVGIAAAALLFPFILGLLEIPFLRLRWAFSDSRLLFPLARFLLCFVGLLLPTILMGGTLPAITRYFVRDRRTLGRGVGALYAVNTFGAMAGCVAAGFFLIAEIGTEGAVRVGVALNLLAAAGAWVISRTGEGERPAPAGESAPAERAPGPVEGDLPVSPAWILFLFAVAGFTSLAYEVLWTRALLFFLGHFAAYAFATILTTFLFGIAAGSAAYPLLFRKGRNLLLGFALIEIGIGIFGAASIAVFGGLFELIEVFERAFPSGSWWKFILARAGGSFAVVLLPTFLMGVSFPLVSAMYARAGRGYGSTVGNVYAANTAGAILGSLLAGFLLLPLLGQSESIAFVALLNVVLGGVLLSLAAPRGRGRSLALAFALLLAAAGAGNLIGAEMRPMILHTQHFADPNRPVELLYFDEGATASIAVLHDVNLDHLELNINGESTAYTTYTDMQVHLALAHIPLLLVENPKKVLVIGFGLGSTSYGSVVHPSVEEVRCVELVPKEVETAPYFEGVNHGVLDNPKFRLVIDDGRNYVFTTKDTFDFISFNAVHPSHSPALYTVEFYEQCRERLGEEGVICAWVPNNDFSEDQFRSLLRTFTFVFPHSSLWYVNPNHLVLIGTMKELRIPLARFREKAAYGPVREDLERYTMDDPFQLLAYHLMDETALDRYTTGAPINSDVHPTIEFSHELGTRPEILDAMLYHRSSVFPYLVIDGDEEAVRDTLLRYERATFHLVSAQGILWRVARHPEGEDIVALSDVEFREAFRFLPGDRNLGVLSETGDADITKAEKRLRENPEDGEALHKLLRIDSFRGKWESSEKALALFRGKRTLGVALAEAAVRFERGDLEGAERLFAELAGAPSPHIRQRVGLYVEAIRAERRRASTGLSGEEFVVLAERYWSLGERQRAEDAFLDALELLPHDPHVLYRFGLALEKSGRLDEAEALHRGLPAGLEEGRKDLASFLRALDRWRILIALEERPNDVSRVRLSDGTVRDVDPWDAGLRLFLGLSLFQEGMFDHGSLQFRLATILDDRNADAHLMLGRTLARRGLQGVAEQELKRALSLAPERSEEIRADLRFVREAR
ncbi:MAG: fused MFS/spermidine synthase [Candidatus Eisenbacteria bacterium]